MNLPVMNRRIMDFVLPLVLFGFLAPMPAHASLTDANFTDTLYISDVRNLSQMTGIGWAPDGSNRLFVIRKTGEVIIVQNGVIVTTPFATFSPIYTNSECGLVGFTFDPSFASNGYIYFFVTVSSSEQRIYRYTASGNTGINQTVIMSGLPTAGNNHDGGGIGIGPDGKLYWAIGDLGNGTGVDANLTSLASKVGRANRDGTLPADNPFNDGAGSNNDFIWACGFRNPFTMVFQPGSGKLWMNVVGDRYEQVFVATPGSHAGYNDYENNQPPGYLTPAIKYRTRTTDTLNLTSSGASRSSNVITFTTTSTHGFRLGEKITISGVMDGSFNGAFFVTSVPSATTFTVTQIGANAESGNGTATTLNQGGCISGGAFWDSTAAPAVYRGNFFYGDYVSGRMIRTTLDGSDQVTSVDYFSTSGHLANYIDTAVGPDGAIYYGSVSNGQIRRAQFNPIAQSLIVTPTLSQTDEGGRTAFSVCLATRPASNVTVTTARTSGDSDLTVFSGATLTFTPANYATPQGVVLAAAKDPDTAADDAVFTVSSIGLTAQTVALRAIDNEPLGLVVSVSTLAVPEAGSTGFNVRLSSAPAGNVTVTVSRTSGDTDVSVTTGSSLVFTPANYATPQDVAVSAGNDADAIADTAVVSVQAPGMVTQTVNVTVSDDDAVAPSFTSTPVTQAVVNASYFYQAVATGQPPPTYSLTTTPSGMSIHATTGAITWTPGTTGSFNVTIQAANEAVPNATQSFSIQVAADQPPIAGMTRPYPGEIVSGTNSEWFGDGHDDVGCTQAQFYVDNILVYTDLNTGNHYHFGGSHLLWNSTVYPNGSHLLRMTVTDTAGQTGSIEREVIIANGIAPLEGWRIAKFTESERSDSSISGNNADAEKDGYVNLLEYALGLEPKQHQLPALLPTSSIESSSGQNYLTLRYRRPINGRPDIAYTVQVSGDLINWASGPSATTNVSITSNGDGTETVVVRDNTPVGGSRGFVRLLIATQ